MANAVALNASLRRAKRALRACMSSISPAADLGHGLRIAGRPQQPGQHVFHVALGIAEKLGECRLILIEAAIVGEQPGAGRGPCGHGLFDSVAR